MDTSQIVNCNLFLENSSTNSISSIKMSKKIFYVKV